MSEMRNKAFTLVKLAYQVRTVDKYESRLPIKLRSKLGGTLPSHRGESFLSSAQLLTRILKEEIQGFLKSIGVEYPDELERTILAKFERR